jgi:hypothetical protein
MARALRVAKHGLAGSHVEVRPIGRFVGTLHSGDGLFVLPRHEMRDADDRPQPARLEERVERARLAEIVERLLGLAQCDVEIAEAGHQQRAVGIELARLAVVVLRARVGATRLVQARHRDLGVRIVGIDRDRLLRQCEGAVQQLG